MALPIQTAPKYNCILPSDGKEVKYRPFLVKEQKMLLIAQEENDEAKIFEAVKDLIRSVTFDEIEPMVFVISSLMTHMSHESPAINELCTSLLEIMYTNLASDEC